MAKIKIPGFGELNERIVCFENGQSIQLSYAFELYAKQANRDTLAVDSRFTPPFRVGRKQKRAVLDSNGLEVIIFPKGQEEMAKGYCEALNNSY